MNDSMEQTLKKVINDIDLQGDDEMVFIENREQGIEETDMATVLKDAAASKGHREQRVQRSGHDGR